LIGNQLKPCFVKASIHDKPVLFATHKIKNSIIMKKLVLVFLIIFTFSCENDTVDSFDENKTESATEKGLQPGPVVPDPFFICQFEISSTNCGGQWPSLEICLEDRYCFDSPSSNVSISGNTNIQELVDFRNNLRVGDGICFKVRIKNLQDCENTSEILSYNQTTGIFDIQVVTLGPGESLEFFYCVPNCVIVL
jgi:hypothetical protein